MQHTVTHCNTLQHTATHKRYIVDASKYPLAIVGDKDKLAVVLQCVAVCICGSVLQYVSSVAVCCSVLQCVPVCSSVFQCVAVCICGSVLQYASVAVCWCVLQCVAVCCVLQYVSVAVWCCVYPLAIVGD